MTSSRPNRLAQLMASAERIEVPIAKIEGIHPDVPVECVDSYPKREDDYLRLTETAVWILLLQHPIGVVVSSQAKSKSKPYFVVSGLDTWRAVLAHRLQVPAPKPRGRKLKISQLPSFESVPVVSYTTADNVEDIKLLAHADFWLKLTALMPDAALRDAVFVRAQEFVGRAVLSETTPGIVSLRALADFLGHRSHARLSQLRQKSPPPASSASAPISTPETTDEEPDERAGPVS